MNKNVYNNCRQCLNNRHYKTATQEYVAKLQNEIRALVEQLDTKDKEILELKEKIADYQKLIKITNQQRFMDVMDEWFSDIDEDGE